MRTFKLSLVPALLFTLLEGAGCRSSSVPPEGLDAGVDSGSSELGLPVKCATGFRPRQAASGCEPVLPSADCPPGTSARVGSQTCQPVGWRECPQGFAPDPSGWGCLDILPEKRCPAPTMEVLGQRSCAPIGSCTTGFPPAGATHFVDDSYADAELDSTHFRTLSAALQAAPAKAVVAVEAGTYAEALTIQKPVKLVGRCAEQVLLLGSGPGQPGVKISGVKGVEIAGLTVSDHQIGILVEGGGGLVLERSQLRANQDMGLAVWDAGTVAQVRSSIIRDSLPNAKGQFGWGANVDGGSLSLESSVLSGNRGMGLAVILKGGAQVKQSIIRDTASDSTRAGVGVVVQDGGTVVLEASVLAGNVTYGLLANLSADAVSSATLTACVIRDTLPDPSGFGRAVQVDSKGQAQLTRCALPRNREVAVSVEGEASRVLVESSVIGPTLPDKAGSFGVGGSVQKGGRLTLKDTALVSNAYHGVMVADGGSLVELDGSLIRDTRRDSAGQFGRGINVIEGGRLVMSTSALVANHDYGLFVDGVDGSGKRSEAVLSASVIRDTRPVSETRGGVGVAVQDGARLEIKETGLINNQAVGLYVSDSLGPEKEPCEASVTSALIGPTLPAPDGSQGAGVVCGGKLLMTSVVVASSHLLGIIVANKGSYASLKDVTVDGTRSQASDGEFGHALFGGAESVLEVSGGELRKNAGGGLVVHGGTAIVDGALIRENKIGVHVQGGSALVEAEARPVATDPHKVIITSSTHFVENVVRIGSGVLPLPNPFTMDR